MAEELKKETEQKPETPVEAKTAVAPAAKKACRWWKWLVGVVVALVVVVAIVLSIVVAAINPIIKTSVETIGPKITKSPVTLESVNLSFLRGQLELKGLVVGNPEGYSTPSALEVKDIVVKLKPMSIFSDVIQVTLVDIKDPQVTYEVGLGNSNIGMLQKNISDFTGGSDESAKEAEAKPADAKEEGGKKVVIDHVSVSGGSIHLSAKLLGGHALPIPLPTITLNDLGKENGKAEGTSIVAATSKILNGIFGSVMTAVQKSAAFVGNAAEGAAEGVSKAAGAAVDGVKKLFGK